jgi:hypothetical protein
VSYVTQEELIVNFYKENQYPDEKQLPHFIINPGNKIQQPTFAKIYLDYQEYFVENFSRIVSTEIISANSSSSAHDGKWLDMVAD